MKLLDIAQKRRAVKKYNDQKRIPATDIKYILKVMNTAPTGLGLEHWRLLVIKNLETKASLLSGFTYSNKDKLLESSHAFIFVTKTTEWYFKKNNQELFEKAKKYAEQRSQHLKREIHDTEVYELIEYIKNHDHANNNKNFNEWGKRQAYIALGYGMLAAMELGIYTTPVEGFNKNLNVILRENSFIEKDEEVAVVMFLGYIDGLALPFFGKEQSRSEVRDKVKII